MRQFEKKNPQELKPKIIPQEIYLNILQEEAQGNLLQSLTKVIHQ